MRTRQIVMVVSVLFILCGCRSHQKTCERHETTNTSTVQSQNTVGGVDSTPVPQAQEVQKMPQKTTRTEEIIQESSETIVIQ